MMEHLIFLTGQGARKKKPSPKQFNVSLSFKKIQLSKATQSQKNNQMALLNALLKSIWFLLVFLKDFIYF